MLEFDEAAHRYRVDGKEIPSVTQIISCLYDFSMVPKDVLEAKQKLGTAVHRACELDDEDDLDEESIADEVRGYLEAYRRFRSEKRPQIMMNEVRMAHPKLRFAGTVDRVCKIDGWDWVIDLKTAVSLYPSVGVQLAAYAALIEVNQPTISGLIRGGLKLKPDGTYQLERFASPNDWPCFLSLLNVHNWRLYAASRY